MNGELLESSKTESEPIYGTHYLPRKFKIAIAVPPRNDVDVYSNDLGFIAHVEAGETRGYTIVVGGGFAMTHGKINTYPALAQPLGYVDRSRAVVTAQRDFGRASHSSPIKTERDPKTGPRLRGITNLRVSAGRE